MPRWVNDFRELLTDDGIEAIWVLTPPSAHAEVSLAALAAGKHVFCEKPLARTSEQCRDPTGG